MLGKLQALVEKLRLENNEHYVSKLGRDAIIELYQSADVLPFIVEHDRTALLVPVGDEEDMAEQIIRVQRDPELHARLIENRRREVRRYAWPAVKIQWLNLFRSLAGVQ